MKNLTVQQLKDACKENRFLLLRFASGYPQTPLTIKPCAIL